RLDPGEQCDDGNLLDSDDCLSTCVLARCGDTFIDSEGDQKEECDTFNLGVATCSSLGFAPGPLSCKADCTLDVSQCPLLPTPTPTVPPPTPTPTPTSPPSCVSLTVTVSLVYDVAAVPELAGLVVDLNYPPAAVNIPGSGSDDSVLERVTDVSGAQGFSSILDVDTNSDGTDDQLHNVYAARNNVPPGAFQAVVFDCLSGATVPSAGAFTCVVSDTVDSQANPVEGVGCAVAVSVPSG